MKVNKEHRLEGARGCDSPNFSDRVNEEMITLEEVYCQDGKMPFCVNNNSIKFLRDIYMAQ